MNRWLRVARKDGKPDEFAQALATHTVTTSYVHGKPRFQAWRLSRPPVLLGTFDTESDAKSCAEADIGREGEA